MGGLLLSLLRMVETPLAAAGELGEVDLPTAHQPLAPSVHTSSGLPHPVSKCPR